MAGLSLMTNFSLPRIETFDCLSPLIFLILPWHVGLNFYFVSKKRHHYHAFIEDEFKRINDFINDDLIFDYAI